MTFYDLLWYFTVYSFLGWCSEVIFATVTTGKFVNRGFLNGPVCPIYGFGMSLVLLVLLPFSDNIPLAVYRRRTAHQCYRACRRLGAQKILPHHMVGLFQPALQPRRLHLLKIQHPLGSVCRRRHPHCSYGYRVARALDSLHARRNSGRYFHRAVYHGYHRHRAYHPQAQRKAHRHQRYGRVCAKRATPSRTASVA